MKTINHRKRYSSVLVGICIILLLVSCTNLKAVHEWSKTSLEATHYNELVTTYTDTPERLKRYDPEGPWDDQIDLRKRQAEALKNILSVVSDYMAALAVLSADSTVDYNKDIDGLKTSIEKLNAGISSDTLGAVGSIVKAVLGAAAKAYQAKQVSLIVEQANKPLQNILNGDLKMIIDQDFRRDLNIEKSVIKNYYNDLLRGGSLSPQISNDLENYLDQTTLSTKSKKELKNLIQRGVPSPAIKVAISERQEMRLHQNAVRLKAVDAYLAVLEKVSEGHQKLYDNQNKLDAIDLAKDLYALVVELKKQIQILAES